MQPLFRGTWHRGICACLTLIMTIGFALSVHADDCKRVPNILVLFDASGFMKDRGRYEFFLKQMRLFAEAMPITADGFFNVGIRHYGLKVGLGCENTESVLAIEPWDPERFINSFPKTVSYGISSMAAGLRAAADDVAGVQGKTVILLIGGGIESCKADPIKITERICFNNPDIEIHTFQIGGSPDGRVYLQGIAAKGKGTYTVLDDTTSPAGWYGWMKQNLVMPCAPPQAPSAAPPAAAQPTQGVGPVTFDLNTFSVRSKDRSADAANAACLQAVGLYLKQNPAVRVILHGFSDGKGTPEHNLKLSRQRAEAVARFLMTKYGIPVSQVGIVAHGGSQAMFQPPGSVQERFGRRVEFEFAK